MVIKNKVQYTHGINGCKFVIPIPFLRLLLNREGRVVDTAVFEIILLCFLDLNYKLLTRFTFTVNIENGFTVDRRITYILTVAIGQIFDAMFYWQHHIQKINQQDFVWLTAKEALKAKVSQRIDVAIAQHRCGSRVQSCFYHSN